MNGKIWKYIGIGAGWLAFAAALLKCILTAPKPT